MAMVEPQGLLNNQEVIDQLNIQQGGMREAQAQRQDEVQLQRAVNDRRDQLKQFTNKDLIPAEETRRLEILEHGKAIFEGYHGRKLKYIDQKGECILLGQRLEIKRRVRMIELLLNEKKQILELARTNDLLNKWETQIFAVHCQMMIEAAIMQLISEDKDVTLNSMRQCEDYKNFQMRWQYWKHLKSKMQYY
ncbi:MAG: hypothetical protein EZS28_051356 [Streblomastix strix]|uniref:Uncharacterized protein n=1 Tax=Streblomastix strix TaxID=222440 RepID=A0A5J4T4E6_9EUKA|nr:MAG: hypothetical protein EZS28_051356 [Streblomastix strix]